MNKIDFEAASQNFRESFYKDVRKIELGKKGIKRFSDGEISIDDELEIINALGKRQELIGKIPQILSSSSEYIEFEYFKGTRAFNFLMDLQQLYKATKDLELLILSRHTLRVLNEQLSTFQKVFSVLQKDQGLEKIIIDYPTQKKLEECITLINPWLNKSSDIDRILKDIENICDIFKNSATSLFRDFTPKNVIINDPKLMRDKFLSPEARRYNLYAFIKNGVIDNESIEKQLKHVDFSGLKYKVPKSDDYITLNSHESIWWALADEEKNNFLKYCDDSIFLATFIVRYMRLAFRKVAYDIFLPESKGMRYKNDDSAYYLEMLENALRWAKKSGIIAGDDFLDFLQKIKNKEYNRLPSEFKQNPGGSYYSDVFPC